jgi:hypothetical protein
MLVWAVFLLLSPLLLIATLVFGTRFMSPDEIAFTKVLLVVVGPFAFVFWWIVISHVGRRYRLGTETPAKSRQSCRERR